MILSGEDIARLAKEAKLIEDFDEKGLNGAGYDVRVGAFYRIEGNAHLGKERRELPKAKVVDVDAMALQPGDYILIGTLEKVNMPLDLVGFVFNRSSIFRSGCTTVNAVVDPGYSGVLTFGLKNMSQHIFMLEKGARIAQIVFHSLGKSTSAYNGRYQGGRVV